MSENYKKRYENLWDVAEEVLGGKPIAVNDNCLKKDL